MSFAFGIGIGTQNNQGEWLEVYYQQPILTPDKALIDVVESTLDYQGGNQAIAAAPEQLKALANALRQVGQVSQANLAEKAATSARPVVVTVLASDDAASSTPEVYLKLHLLSHRLVKPHGVRLDGIFGLLPNVAWTSEGAIDLNAAGTPAQGPSRRPHPGSEICGQVPANDRLRGAQGRAYRRYRPGTVGCLCG